MDSRKGRPFAVLLALVIGIAIGWLIFRRSVVPVPALAPTPTQIAQFAPTPTPTPGDYLIIVGPDAATLNYPTAYIGWDNKIVWQSNDKQSLSIVFPVSGFPPGVTLPPFDDMKEVKQGAYDDYVFQHPLNSSTIASGKPSAALQKVVVTPTNPHGELTYKYDQILADTRKDGRIIIKW